MTGLLVWKGKVQLQVNTRSAIEPYNVSQPAGAQPMNETFQFENVPEGYDRMMSG